MRNTYKETSITIATPFLHLVCEHISLVDSLFPETHPFITLSNLGTAIYVRGIERELNRGLRMTHEILNVLLNDSSQESNRSRLRSMPPAVRIWGSADADASCPHNL